MTESAYVVSTVAGCSEAGFIDGRGVNTKFKYPIGLAFSKDSGILIADYSNHCIRKVIVTGRSPAYVETFAGVPGQSGHRDEKAAKALFSSPYSVSVSDSGTVYVADFGNHRIRSVSYRGVPALGSGKYYKLCVKLSTVTHARNVFCSCTRLHRYPCLDECNIHKDTDV